MTTYFYEGQLVTLMRDSAKNNISKDELFEVTKVNPKNLKVRRVSNGQPMYGPKIIWSVADDLPPAVREAALASTPVKVEETVKFSAGQVVRRKTSTQVFGKWHYAPAQLFVVIRVSADKVNIVKLGGEGGQYWRMLPGSLEIVKNETISTTL